MIENFLSAIKIVPPRQRLHELQFLTKRDIHQFDILFFCLLLEEKVAARRADG